MGHSDPRFTTSTAYKHFDPDHLVNCMKATDAIMLTLDKLTRKSLFAPNSLPNTGLVVIENKGKNIAQPLGHAPIAGIAFARRFSGL